MKKREQIKLVKDLTKSVAEGVVEAIRAGKIPEDWDGIELRQLLADKFEFERIEMGRKRKKDYRNTVLVDNL